MPLPMVYHAPERPKLKPYSEQPVVAVPPSHSPAEAQTMAKTAISAPWKLSDVLLFLMLMTPMKTVRAKYRTMMIV